MRRISGIYVPGLGDDKTRGQDSAIEDWNKRGIDLEYHAIGWADKDTPFSEKLDLLCKRIDELYEESGRIVLVGSSAGASAVLNAYVRKRDKVRAVVTICGKIQQKHPLKPNDFTDNPPFRESLKILPATLRQLDSHDLDHIMTAYPWFDGRVPIEDAQISGAHHQRINMVGHFLSIATAITIGKRPLAKFIQST